MRRVQFVLAAVLAGIVGTACETTQPAVGGSRTATVQLEARALVYIKDCYEEWQDTNADNQPDQFVRNVCFQAMADGDEVNENRVVPWRYSIRFAMLRAGQTFPEVIAGSVNNGGTFPTFGSMTAYDPILQSAPIKLPVGALHYLNPRRVSTGNEVYLASVDLNPPGGGGPTGPLPVNPPNMLGETAANLTDPPQFNVDLNAGDALIVEAAKQPYGFGLPILQFGPAGSNLRISARLFVAGSSVTPTGGTIESSNVDGSGLSFNYLSQ